VTEHLVDIDDEALRAARAELGTTTIQETVNQALRGVAGRRAEAVNHALNVLGRAELRARDELWR